MYVFSLSHLDTERAKWITALPGRPFASMILSMEDKQVLVFDEKSINNKDARSCSNSISSNNISLGVLIWNILISTHRGSLPCQAIPTHDIDYSQFHGCFDGPAMQVKFQPQGTFPTKMKDKHIFVVGTFLMKHKDLIILHGQYHVCWWPDDLMCHEVRKREYSRTPRLILLLMLSSFASPGHQHPWY